VVQPFSFLDVALPAQAHEENGSFQQNAGDISASTKSRRTTMVQLPLHGDVLVFDAQRAPIHVSSCLSLVKRPCNVAGVRTCVNRFARGSLTSPWSLALLSFMHLHLLVALFGSYSLTYADQSRFYRFLYHTIQTHVLPSSLLPTLLRTLRLALFPNNSMGPPAPPPPSTEERLAIKRRAAESVRGLIPTYVAHSYYATNDDDTIVEEITEDILDSLDDTYLNKHLVYAILELVLVRLIPELSEQPISDLLAGRGVGWEEAAALGFDNDDTKGEDEWP